MKNYSLTISCATTSGTSFSKSNANSMAPVSLYFPFNFLWSSTHSLRAIEAFFPSSSSASSTLTPVSSAKKAWFNKSLMVYLGERTVELRFRYKHVFHTLQPLIYLSPWYKNSGMLIVKGYLGLVEHSNYTYMVTARTKSLTEPNHALKRATGS